MPLETYRALFVSESEAHLDALGRGILALEAEGSDVNEVFRHLHSLKGMSATMGYDDARAACHALEDLVGEARDKQRKVDRELIDLLLFATDQLALFVSAIRDAANPPPLDGVVRRVRGAMGQRPTTPAQAAGVPLMAHARFTLRVTIDPGSATPALRAFLASKRLVSAVGLPLGQTPTLEELKAGVLPEHTLLLFYSAAIDEERVRRAMVGLSDVQRFAIEPISEAPPATRAPQQATRVVRVRTGVLDDLLDAAGELLIAESRVRDVSSAALADGAVVRVFEQLHQTIRNVHSRVMALRMVPFSTVAERYPRTVRDAAAALGKLIDLKIVGQELELDRAVLETVDASIMHLLRNAVDHGIETPERRQHKPKSGTIVLRAERDRDAVAISVEDDGMGIDEAALRAAASGRGLVTPPGPLSPVQLLRILTSPGFSTKTQVSALSGRGVGLDVVSDTIAELGGSLELSSEPGAFTRFVMRLPPTIAVLPVVRVGQATQRFGIALRRVLATEELTERPTPRTISFRGEQIAVRSLGQALGAEADEHMAVIVATDTGPVAITVERVLDVRDAVVKKLGPPLNRMPLFDGATLLGDGQPMMILDVRRLIGQDVG